MSTLAGLTRAMDDLAAIGNTFWQRGWSVGTSSNYSTVVSRDPLRLVITASGRDKGRLTHADFVLVDGDGQAIEPRNARPSAETLLHTLAVRELGAGAVLHTHSVWGTVLSDMHPGEEGFTLEGYEMLKGLSGVKDHAHVQWLHIFENSQDMEELSSRILARMRDAKRPLRHGFLLRNHGLYTWGATLDEARRHVEVFEFLFEVIGRKSSLGLISRPARVL